MILDQALAQERIAPGVGVVEVRGRFAWRPVADGLLITANKGKGF
jgi:hypothetical protein